MRVEEGWRLEGTELVFSRSEQLGVGQEATTSFPASFVGNVLWQV